MRCVDDVEAVAGTTCKQHRLVVAWPQAAAVTALWRGQQKMLAAVTPKTRQVVAAIGIVHRAEKPLTPLLLVAGPQRYGHTR